MDFVNNSDQNMQYYLMLELDPTLMQYLRCIVTWNSTNMLEVFVAILDLF